MMAPYEVEQALRERCERLMVALEGCVQEMSRVSKTEILKEENYEPFHGALEVAQRVLNGTTV